MTQVNHTIQYVSMNLKSNSSRRLNDNDRKDKSMVQYVSETPSLTFMNVFHVVLPQYVTHKILLSILVLLNVAVILSTFVCMMPGTDGNTTRQPSSLALLVPTIVQTDENWEL